MKVHEGPTNIFFYYTIIFISDGRLCHKLAFMLVVGVIFQVVVEEGETQFPDQFLQLRRIEKLHQSHELAFSVDNIVAKRKTPDMLMVESL